MGWTCWEWILDLTQSGGKGYGGQMSKWDMVKEGKILKWEEDKPKILRVFPFSRKDLKNKIFAETWQSEELSRPKVQVEKSVKIFAMKFLRGRGLRKNLNGFQKI